VTRLVVDPVTRIGGHLRIELEVRGGVVADAWSAATMYRGVERILEGRDPRDAWLVAQRVCGMCGAAHALASVRAVEDALRIRIPRNARLLRNLLHGAEFVLDHVVSFYHLQLLDWVDVRSAAGADPAATASLAARTARAGDVSEGHFARVRDRIRALLESGQPGPLSAGPWGHPAYRLDPAANLLLVAHYLDALEFQRSFSRIHNLLGGKNPHPQTFLVGGMTLAPRWGGPATSPRTHPGLVDRNAPSPLTEPGLALLATRIAEARAFVDGAFVPDVITLAAGYPEWWSIGAGVRRFLAYGEFPQDDTNTPALLLPGGLLDPARLDTIAEIETNRIVESVAHAHYAEPADATPRRPWDGVTEPRYGGPSLPYETLEGAQRYSWSKAARYAGLPAETGALARILLADLRRVAVVGPRLDAALGRAGVGREAMASVMGRTLARAIEAQVVAHELEAWRTQLAASLATGDLAVADVTRWQPDQWFDLTDGRSLGESPRGAVGHWVRIRDRRVDNYQIVDGNTWNGSPRDRDGLRGPWEEALVSTRLVDPDRPLEALRVLRSFDPCATCAVHALSPLEASR
jgi:hydrogenase large subunit